ncbi:MAG: helicase-related protein, partial [Gemmatimonadales bacterium]
RTLAAVRRYRGALLADPAGTGKTWIGLAVAAALDRRPAVHVVAPATLRSQWAGVARRAGVAIRFHSHELLSRGKPPGPEPGPVIIDESHRLRNPDTHRYRTIAPWCIGRSGILLSATPAVNRFEDVLHQLLLLIRDDALAGIGAPSLRAVPAGGWAGALARLLVTGEDRGRLLPVRRARDLRIEEPPDSPLAALQHGIASLRLSSDPASARLIRISLLAALASSPLAAAEALARYRSLLRHAGDAAAAGLGLSRQAIRRWVGAETDQLVLWPLVAETVPGDLALEDLEPVHALERLARSWSTMPDAKVRALAVLRDAKPTLVFTAALGTVRYLRRHLGPGVAWCTGTGSGIDALELARDEVLDWFRRPSSGHPSVPRRPALLVATDVASEGLDLPLVERVTHYDLPWTAVRLDQRSGRAFRLGARQSEVEVIRLLPPKTLEAALRKEAILDGKANLPRLLGLGREANAPWRVRGDLAARWDRDPVLEGVARVPGPGPGWIAGIRIEYAGGSADETVFARIGGDRTDDGARMAFWLEPARALREAAPPDPTPLRLAITGISGIARRALRAAHGAPVVASAGAGPARRAQRRLLSLAREAARRRDQDRLLLLDHGLRFLRRGHTAGESSVLEDWSTVTTAELLRRLAALPKEEPAPEITGMRLIGVLLVDPVRSSQSG